ncbi:flagellar hook-basal body protein [Metasolibacillus meyeri]|uniref:Flagellar hook-basal body protein n=1 Tax=Metasolibacillus meyeri TaxID=1071052 RepID=A0AAW9NJ15_9BACL|nr:flagellar hook-basal body protein [Metasolibacillus meyeri]MEC1177722.1 flagellar hook-basal body protein [Metasolibacillus meyeri]
MLRTMVTATNTLTQLQTKLDTISDNLANSNTHGYKTKDAQFSELLYQQYNNDKLDRTLRQSPVGIRYGVGAHVSLIQANQKQGSLQQTDRDLDFAFTKENQYFNILMPDGDGQRTVYTRQGDFYVSPMENGQMMLVNGNGHAVADSAGNAIYFPDFATGFTLSPNGQLNVSYPDGDVITVDLAVTELQKPQTMEHVSGTYIGLPTNLAALGYTQADILTDLQGANRGGIGLSIQTLEMSNVDISKEMTELIATQRSYQFNSRAVTLADQMLGLINGIR